MVTPIGTTRLLLHKGPDANFPDNHGHTPLMWAALEGHAEVARLLFAGIAEIDPNAQSAFGRTALMGAVSTGHQAVVEVLLNTPDTDFNMRDKYGRTALSEAQKRGYTVIFSLLLRKISPSSCLDSAITGKLPMTSSSPFRHTVA